MVLLLKVHISNIFLSGLEELLSQGAGEVQFLFSVSLVEMCLFCSFELWCQVSPTELFAPTPLWEGGEDQKGKSEKAFGLVQLL